MEPSDIITVTRSGTTISTVALPRVSKANIYEHNFVAFLGATQALGIDFLPITWQSAMEDVGRGATAEIRQSLLSLQTSLAFKRIQPSPFSKRSEKAAEEAETKVFHAIISEASVLALTGQHPNIACLFGICWDVTKDGQAWPVLVFKKAPHGNMDDFVRLNLENARSWVTRVKLVTGIARAVEYMHARKIIHGDIKPQNVLIFEDNPGDYVAKVTDFSFSTVDIDDGLINLPFSTPWVHPEQHRNGYKFGLAAKMDAYSFGMLCFWIFLHDVDDYPDLEMLQQEQKKHDMPGVAARLTNSTAKYGDQQKMFLFKIFGMTLNHDHELRSNFNEIANLLEEGLRPISSQDSKEAPGVISNVKIPLSSVVHANFQIAPAVHELLFTDYRVRVRVFQAFSKHLERSNAAGHLENASQAAFQLAFCYHTGFGVRRDIATSLKFLALSKSSIEDLKKQLGILQMNTFYEFRDREFQDMWNNGLAQGMNLAQYYRDNPSSPNEPSLSIEISECEREIKDLIEVIGDSHPLVLSLKSILAHLLHSSGSWLKASEIFAELLAIHLQTHGESDRITMGSMYDLAIVYRDLGRWDRSEELALRHTEICSRHLGDEHAETLASMGNLSLIYTSRGNWEQATRLTQRCLDLLAKVRGENHPDTLNQVETMVCLRIGQGEWLEAEALAIKNSQLRSKVLGATHPDTLQSRLHLANIYHEQGFWEKAEEIETDVVDIYTRTIGPQHPHTLDCISDLCLTYSAQGRWEESETLYIKVLHDMENIIGPEHPSTIASWAGLSTIYREQSKFSEAEKIDLRVHEISVRIFGPDHFLTITSLNDLAFTYTKIDRPKEAEEIITKVIMSRIQALGPDHVNTMTSQTILASAFADQGRYKEAKDLEELIWEKRKGILGDDHPDTLISMSNLAIAFWELGDLARAEELEASCLEKCSETLGSEHPHTLSAMTRLSATCVSLGRLEKAEDLAVEAWKLSEEVRGIDHENTWDAMAQVAHVYHKQKRLVEARNMYQKALDLRLEGLREDNWQYVENLEMLKRVLKDIEDGGELVCT